MPKAGTDAPKEPQFRRAPKRFTSIRAARRWMEQVMRECYRGERPMSHGPQAAQTVKAWAEMFLTEKQLARLGEDMEEARHPLGRDGNMPADEPGIARERKVEHVQGTGPKGEIDMTTVSETDAVPGQPVELEGSGPAKDQIAQAAARERAGEAESKDVFSDEDDEDRE